jgi:UDP-N-acetyl-D-glucosamine dehydrogenase
MGLKNKKVCVVGLGYVGYPLAVLASAKGYDVIGFDKDKKKVKLANRKANFLGEKFLDGLLPRSSVKATSNPSLIRQSRVFLICVPTPVDEKYYPILEPIKNASLTIARNMKAGALVILESTVNPGVCEEIIKPIFEEAGWTVGKNVFIAHCPERINPGDPKWNVSNIPRVIGSFDKKGLKQAEGFYENILDAPIMPMKFIREAEAVKIVENSFRDINIAFVNELAKSFDRMNIDIVDVIRGASTKPFAFMPHWPGCGVGGHCIPVDPYYLIERAKKNDFDHKFLRAARNINNSMPAYTVELLQNALNLLKKSVKNARIGILGVSYKADVGDLRESPALKIKKLLEAKQAKIIIYDPYLPQWSNVKNIKEALKKSEVLVIVTNHKEFTAVAPEEFARNKIKVIIDGRNCLEKDKIQKLGIIYKGIGR